MDVVTLDKLAQDVGTTVERLIQQFAEAGLTKQAGDNVSEDEKQALQNETSNLKSACDDIRASAESARLAVDRNATDRSELSLELESLKQKMASLANKSANLGISCSSHATAYAVANARRD